MFIDLAYNPPTSPHTMQVSEDNLGEKKEKASAEHLSAYTLSFEAIHFIHTVLDLQHHSCRHCILKQISPFPYSFENAFTFLLEPSKGNGLGISLLVRASPQIFLM